MSDEMSGFELLKKWSFVPITLERADGVPVLVTDLDENGGSRTRRLNTGDFRFTDKAVPNWGMFTYVGLDEISKHIDRLTQDNRDLREALEELVNNPNYDLGNKMRERLEKLLAKSGGTKGTGDRHD